MKKELWFDGRGLKGKSVSLILDASNRGYETVIVEPEEIENIKISNRIKKAINIEENKEIEKYKKADIVIVDSIDKYKIAKNIGKEVAYYMRVDDKESMEKAAELDLDINYLIIEFKDTTNIPLELILAKQQKKTIKILKVVTDIPDALVSMGVMEVGATGVVLKTDSIDIISELGVEMKKREEKKVDIVECEIKEIRHLELGERACLDTTVIMEKTEGMIVGCTSNGGLLVCSEVHYLPYMNTRPFRVNAGTVSSYVWGPENIVEYISDLKAGSKVLAVSTNGESRTVNIARVKTEVRPLILIVASYKETEIKVIMQDDWHMRVFNPKGEPVNITDLKPGDKVLGHCSDPGRHVGVKIQEKITEK